MKLVKGLAYGICTFALASAAWANDTAPVIPGTESSEPELLVLEVPAEQFVIVEEWYVFPSSEEPSLGG